MTAVNPQAKRVYSKPAGIWRDAVRGFRASISASRMRLNAMAADRAPTIATTIQSKAPSEVANLKSAIPPRQERPGQREREREQTECSNLIISSVRRRRFQKRFMIAELHSVCSISDLATILGDAGRDSAAIVPFMNRQQLTVLLEQVREGATPVDAAIDQLRHMPFEDLGFANVDHHRALRHGMPEVIFGQGKTLTQVQQIAQALLARSSNVLVTRATAEMAAGIRNQARG